MAGLGWARISSTWYVWDLFKPVARYNTVFRPTQREEPLNCCWDPTSDGGVILTSNNPWLELTLPEM
jgi:hypothetical protein